MSKFKLIRLAGLIAVFFFIVSISMTDQTKADELKPDLIITDLIIRAGSNNMGPVVKNNSSFDITSSVIVKIKDLTTGKEYSTGQTYTADYPFKGGASICIDSLDNLSDGAHKLEATADYGNSIAESNENNNTYTREVNIGQFSDPSSLLKIENLKAYEIGEKSAKISFDTNIDSYQNMIIYEIDGEKTHAMHVDFLTPKHHEFEIFSLKPGTNYKYKAYANLDAIGGGEVYSGEANFTTLEQGNNQITQINSKAKLLFEEKIDSLLTEINISRNTIKEQQNEIKYLKSLKQDINNISQKVESINNQFITYGVDENTKKLGEGERAAVIYSYKAAFNKLPESEEELSDAIKIANGRFPSILSSKAEQKAKEQFTKIYKRLPDMNGVRDAAAVKIMAYGLRQKAENRNLNSEKAGIKIFKGIFGYTPKTTEEWNMMQAITYSGASQKTWDGYNPQ